ncbi:MFS transporter [Sediminibacterium soli]|uniref:MFS transporter n=1 Tax=Sediminibacterium soli TaxID=2698829 RepID=UPI00137A820C|nr:MFS transporter [Sediminibacterium soli]NCI45835.1 MFS transporter [Sediminibacterium soli]
MPASTRILPTIVIAQFLCTSVWFAGNAVLPELSARLQLPAAFLSYLTSAVQLGFISGTLLFAILAVADRFLPSRIFFLCSLAAAVCNIAIIHRSMDGTWLLLLRYLTGFFLAGIYPVGMKIAADHYKEGLGRSLGFLVGALVLGTAFPHLLRSFTVTVPWQQVIVSISIACVAGGTLVLYRVPEGPYRKQGQQLSFAVVSLIGKQPGLRAAALGYFGHMWELYTVWAFLPLILKMHFAVIQADPGNISLLAFLVIGIGGIACMTGGVLSKYYPAKNIATLALAVSGCCCLLLPLFISAPTPVLLVYLLVWGAAIAADSPLFSSIVALEAPAQVRGSVITLVTSIGFAITILSIQFINAVYQHSQSSYVFMLLAAGPFAGVWSLLKKKGH